MRGIRLPRRINADPRRDVACDIACYPRADDPTHRLQIPACRCVPGARRLRHPGTATRTGRRHHAAAIATTTAIGTLLPPVPQPPERPLAPASVTDPAIPQAQRIDAFVDYTASTYGVDPQTIRAELAQAVFKQNTITAISRPAEAVRPWRDYRPIFLTDARINGGKAFYAANRDALERVAASTGVPAEYIVAIIGVETSYGRITGNTRVLDALYTLAFGWPKRAPFFAGELAQLFALGKDEGIDVSTLTGSYAGAMGWGQFMPSSYRNWAQGRRRRRPS